MTRSGPAGPWSAGCSGEGLPNELHLLVFPVVHSRGKRLLAGPGHEVPLQLAASAAFEHGVLNLTYPRAAPMPVLVSATC
jgi:hypothetical protein